MKKKILFLIPTLLIMTIALSACNHPDSHEEKAEWIMHKITRSLELRKDQIAKLHDIKNEIMKHQKQHKIKKAEILKNIKTEITKPSIDRIFFLKLIEQHKTNIDTIAPSIIDKIIVFHESLTSEQKIKILEILKKFKMLRNKQLS